MIAIRVSLCLHEHMQIYCDPPDVSRRSPSSPVPATGSVFCGSVSSACAIYFFFGIHVKRKPTCKDADLELRVHWTNFCAQATSMYMANPQRMRKRESSFRAMQHTPEGY